MQKKEKIYKLGFAKNIMFNFFRKKVEKDEFDKHKGAVQTALNNAKTDVQNLVKWVEHLNNVDSGLKGDVDDIYSELATVKSELEELKNMVALAVNPRLLKQRQTAVGKQTVVYGVENAVQTTVQAEFLDRLSMSERALVMALLTTEMKLSYDDLAALSGKDSTTVRGQINGIRQKCEGLIEEMIEKNNKKRLFIPDKIKETLLKRVKVRAKR